MMCSGGRESEDCTDSVRYFVPGPDVFVCEKHTKGFWFLDIDNPAWKLHNVNGSVQRDEQWSFERTMRWAAQIDGLLGR